MTECRTWAKDGKRTWKSSDGQIITNESFTAGGIRVRFFAVYACHADRGKGRNYASGETLREAKSKVRPQ